MKNNIILIIISICFELTLSCQTKKQNETNINEVITADVFETKLKTDIQLLDVRTPEEYTNGHILKSHNLDITSENWQDEINKLDKNKTTLVYCKSGGRSADAAERLTIAGFKTVYNLEGGIIKWQAAGKHIEKSELSQTNNGLTLADYELISKSKLFVLVDFNAKWCGPCKELSPILEKIAAQKKAKLKLIKIDADENQDLLIAKAIDGIPYLELFNNGKLIWSYKGFINEKDLIYELSQKGLK